MGPDGRGRGTLPPKTFAPAMYLLKVDRSQVEQLREDSSVNDHLELFKFCSELRAGDK